MAHIRKTVLGLKGLYIADVVSTLEAAEWKQLALNLEGTFSFTQDDTEETQVNVEENDTPIVQILKAGSKSFTTSIPDLAFEVVEELMGASKYTATEEGTSITRVKLPDSAEYIYKMFKIVPAQGIEQIFYTKGQVSAKINGNLSKTETLNLDLKATALVPDGGGLTAVMYDIKEGTNPGYWLGKRISETAFASITGVSIGAMKLTVDGGTEQVITGLDFTASTDWDDIVSVLNAGTTGAVWSFDVNEYRFTITSNTLGGSSQITIATSSGIDMLTSTYLYISGGTPVIGS